ncbi:MAG TPA: lysozyme inhibitor LprI family protein [Hyphomicrobiaceae bacterium]|nr:lysozyme inhibitor LprI family protein [Hyphomicrobiaceae bacterium]
MPTTCFRRAALLGAISLAAIASPLVAQPATPPTKIDCETAKTTPDIAWCAGEELKAADAELNKAYQAALTYIAKADHLNVNQRRDWRRALQEAQRHWLAFRKKDCGEVTGWEWYGGTGMGTASLGCEIAKTKTRTEELKARYGKQ